MKSVKIQTMLKTDIIEIVEVDGKIDIKTHKDIGRYIILCVSDNGGEIEIKTSRRAGQ